MLYGTNQYRRELFKNIAKVSEEKNIDIIFAGIVGSVARGISMYDSDYEIKCLFVDRGGVLNICMMNKL